MTKKKLAKPLTGKCFNCGKAVTEDDFCFGCKAYVCEECNTNGLNVPWGGHDKSAHTEDADL